MYVRATTAGGCARRTLNSDCRRVRVAAAEGGGAHRDERRAHAHQRIACLLRAAGGSAPAGAEACGASAVPCLDGGGRSGSEPPHTEMPRGEHAMLPWRRRRRVDAGRAQSWAGGHGMMLRSMINE